MRTKYLSLIMTLVISMFIFQLGFAQSETPITLSLAKNFGYNDFSGQIQGNFTLKAEGPQDLVRVIFLIDGQPMAETTQAPFKHNFNTDNYPAGVHSFIAQGYTASGQELISKEIRKEFISGSESRSQTAKIIIPVLGVVFGALLISALFSIRVGRKKLESLPPGAPRSYGALGGTICPNCERPFGMHIWGLNMLVGKLDRCPYCGKWSLVRHQSLEALHAAEQAELTAAQDNRQFQAPSDEERLHKDLEDSRFQDL